MYRSTASILGLVSALLMIAITACGAAWTAPGNGPVVATPRPTRAPTASRAPLPAPGQAASDTWSLWTQGSRLRGANVYQRRVYVELDGNEFMGPSPVGPPYTQQDLNRLAALGANYVNISHPGLFTEAPSYTLDPDMQASLDSLLSMVAQADLYAVISFRTGPGRAEFSVCCLGDDWFPPRYLNDTVWSDQAAQDAWVAMWRHTAERYRDHAIVAGYDLMVEPNANEVLTGEWLDPGDFYAQYGGTLADWNQLFPRITTAIREVDTGTPLLVGGMGYSGVEWLPYVVPSDDPRTVYIVHQYAPHLYTHQWGDTPKCTYPGTCDLDWDGDYDDSLDSAWLTDLLVTVDNYATAHSVPVAVNEFGIVRWADGAAAFMDDQMALFEQHGWNHALWAWEPAWEPWSQEVTAFNFRFGPDPENHSDLSSNALQETIVSYWDLNTVRPSSQPVTTTISYLPMVSATDPVPAPLALDKVAYWAYQLQGISEPGAVEALVSSRYDMLVLEPTCTDWSSDDRYFDTAAMVARLKTSTAHDGAHGKLILAYLDIGEAEDWRWYWTWSRDWNCRGEPPADWPEYILSCDPDGWGGNYPVAYWHPDWKDIIIYGSQTGTNPDRDYSSAIDEAIAHGFDGIYLDWVEGWEDDVVDRAARAEGKDPAAEMITFIAEMRAYATARKPGFLIVQQNAAELLDGRPELLDNIDAISQEAVWYDGDATDEWQDPDGYDWPQPADLTAYYLTYLAPYQNAGVPVFNCEYALDQAATAYERSYTAGFVPYVTRRSLSRLTTTPPPGYQAESLREVEARLLAKP